MIMKQRFYSTHFPSTVGPTNDHRLLKCGPSDRGLLAHETKYNPLMLINTKIRSSQLDITQTKARPFKIQIQSPMALISFVKTKSSGLPNPGESSRVLTQPQLTRRRVDSAETQRMKLLHRPRRKGEITNQGPQRTGGEEG